MHRQPKKEIGKLVFSAILLASSSYDFFLRNKARPGYAIVSDEYISSRFAVFFSFFLVNMKKDMNSFVFGA